MTRQRTTDGGHHDEHHDHWRAGRPAGDTGQAPALPAVTVDGLTDEQAARSSTVSELCLAGLIKHVAWGERQWIDFILDGPCALGSFTDHSAAVEQFAAGFRVVEDETLTGLLEHYAQVARRTDEIVATLPDLDVSHPLPTAPWFEPGVRWSARRVLLHIIAETAQHAGHADILRESIDGTKSMG